MSELLEKDMIDSILLSIDIPEDDKINFVTSKGTFYYEGKWVDSVRKKRKRGTIIKPICRIAWEGPMQDGEWFNRVYRLLTTTGPVDVVLRYDPTVSSEGNLKYLGWKERWKNGKGLI